MERLRSAPWEVMNNPQEEISAAAPIDPRDTRGSMPQFLAKKLHPRVPGFFTILRIGGTAGIMVRRFLPACFLVPAIVAVTEYIAQDQNLFRAIHSMAFSTAMISSLFILVIWRCGVQLHRIDKHHASEREELERKYEEAAIANRVKGAFLASMSHEIRTPLTAICGFADLLMTKKRSLEEREDFIKTIRRNGEHLLTITNDILDLSKIEAGKMRVENVITSPVEVIAEVCSMLRAPAIEKDLTLEVTYDGPVPARIRTDPTRLRQALINLVGNAIKFTEAGRITIVAGLATDPTDKNPFFRIAVTDTGIGLTEEQINHLFVPFAQADVDTARKFGGTGLGLSICKHLAGLLGGDISVSSKPGVGSTFTMTLATGSLEGIPLLKNPHEAGVAPTIKLPEKFQLKGRILLAEDGASNQKLITIYLREAGCSVDIVSNGQQAVEKVLVAWRGGLPYDVILMDMLMPVVDGYEATIQLRQAGYTRPIVALTANALAGDRNKCLSTGCNDFMTKPIEPMKFMKLIERQLKVAAGMPVNRPTSNAA